MTQPVHRERRKRRLLARLRPPARTSTAALTALLSVTRLVTAVTPAAD